MNYLKDLKVMAANLLELESLFHGIFNIEDSPRKEKTTSIRRYQVLSVIEKEGKQNLTNLCDKFHMRKNSCSELLDRMLKDQLLERIPSTTDRRKIYYNLTEKGKQQISHFEDLFVERVSKLFESLPEKEIKEFIGALETMVTAARRIKL